MSILDITTSGQLEKTVLNFSLVVWRKIEYMIKNAVCQLIVLPFHVWYAL